MFTRFYENVSKCSVIKMDFVIMTGSFCLGLVWSFHTQINMKIYCVGVV